MGYLGIVAAAPTLMLAIGLIPTITANRAVVEMRKLASAFSMLAVLAAIFGAIGVTRFGVMDVAFVTVSFPVSLSLGLYFDSLSAIMLLLVSFIGWIIVRYSVRYLEGERNQGQFLRWTCFTLGSVMVLIVARNLVMFAGAWMMTSYGLHKLLTYYPDRAAAMLTARKKFLISRIGDLMLLAALILTYRVFGSFEYQVIFDAAKELAEAAAGGLTKDYRISLIGMLFAVGAMTKSAQFPFHSWLPDTLETPTPVSALMHAGIINAGGFLVIRLSPLVSLSHIALDMLAIVGGITALLGVVVMMTQTSVKRSLAYSTVAQMGFMMLQCGLGAFSAALLHIVAHSLYKAHAFLSSGSVLEAAASTRMKKAARTHAGSTGPMVLAIVLAICLLAAAATLTGVWPHEKPGGLILGFVLTMSLMQLMWKAFQAGTRSDGLRAFATAGVVAGCYYVAYLGFDAMLSKSVSHSPIILSWMDSVVMAILALSFFGVFLLQVVLNQNKNPRLLNTIYVHASNGFYFDLAVHKLVRRLYGSTSV
jgi:NAD(P)H-quinone oxidoreductase subunit 5